MKRNFILLTAIVFSFAIVSCQKEVDDFASSSGNTTANNGSTTGDIRGAWKFVNFRVKSVATNEVSAAGMTVTTVTTSDYTSEKNSGTIVIDAANMSYTNLSYDMNTIAYAKVFENGVLLDTFSVPMHASVPATSNKAAYTRIGSDSLYFQSGNIFSNGNSQASPPGGAKIKFEQDKLYILQKVNQTEKTTDQGQTLTSVTQAEVTVTLQKQ